MKNDIKGLTNEEVSERINKGLVNRNSNDHTKTIKEIVLSNVFTYFNILNVSLSACVLLVGIFTGNLFNSIKNCLFLGVVFCNTVISIYQEITAKKTIDKMNLVVNKKVMVIRNEKKEEINLEDIVQDDVIELSIGKQIVVDGNVLTGEIEVNESLLTGESNSILKHPGDELKSGSFVVSGEALMVATKVGKDSYINSLAQEAKNIERNKSVIFTSFENLIKILSFIIIPLGILLFFNQYYVVKSDFYNAVVSTVAALIGMIPEGLVLLTSSVMAVSVIRLSKYNVLVQHLYSIESLARVNVICLDKTGTITTGNMKLKDYVPIKISKDKFAKIITEVLSVLPDNSSTMDAVREYFNEKVNVSNEGIIPFSSERKFSACQIDGVSYYVGAPEYILKVEDLSFLGNNQELYRTLIIASNKEKLSKKPNNLTVVGYLLIEDEIREEAHDTLAYFKEQGVKVKIISGDNYKTVLKIANRVGLEDAKGIDTSGMSEKEIQEVADYDVFGRVTPQNKKMLVEALKNKGYFVAMTGDGVNDVLALKEANCSIGLGNGSDAAKSVSELVLLDSNFASLPKIVAEGRRTINNIERSASLLLVKTIYTILLIWTCIFFKSEYFFIPIQLTLITTCTIGIPSFILALEPNTSVVHGEKFLFKIIMRSLPGSITVFLNVLIILFCKKAFILDDNITNTLCVFLTATTGFIHLYNVSKPFNTLRTILLVGLIMIFTYAIIFQNKFFNISDFNLQISIIFFLLFIFSTQLYVYLKKLVDYILKKIKS